MTMKVRDSLIVRDVRNEEPGLQAIQERSRNAFVTLQEQKV